MRPTRLAVRGLKRFGARDFSMELSKLTAIEGPNGAGKTAIIQAIRLALLGYDPEVGRQLSATRKLIAADAPGELAEIALGFDSGFVIMREFGERTKTTVTPSRGESTGRQCQERINEETGGLVVALDVAEFLELSDEKRREWLFQHLPRDGTELDFETFSEWVDRDESPVAAFADDLWKHSIEEAPNAVVGLSTAIDVAHQEALSEESVFQAQRHVVTRHDDIVRSAEEPEPVTEEDFQAIEDTLAAVNQRIGGARAGRDARERLETRLGTAESALGGVRSERAHQEAVVRDLQEQLDAMGKPPESSDQEGALAAAEARAKELREAERQATETVFAAREKLRGVRARKEAIEELGGCPFAALVGGCETDTEKWKADILEGIQVELAAALDELRLSEAAQTGADASWLEATRTAAELQRAIDGVDETWKLFVETQRGLGTAMTKLAELLEREELHAESVQEVEAELSALGDDEAVRALYHERDDAERDKRALTVRKEAAVHYASTVAARDREAALLEERRKQRDAMRELDGNLRRLRSHIIRTMITPLTQTADDVLRAMDHRKRFRVVFERENKDVFDFGFEEDGQLRLFDAASKGERVMLTLALVGALLTVINPPMRLLVVDDVEQLDANRRSELLANLSALSDRWDGIILAGACDLSEGTKYGWTVHVLSGEPAVA